jgi:hypothetical protein
MRASVGGVLAFLERLQAVKSVLVRNRRKDISFFPENQISRVFSARRFLLRAHFLRNKMQCEPKVVDFSPLTHRKTVYLQQIQ